MQWAWEGEEGWWENAHLTFRRRGWLKQLLQLEKKETNLTHISKLSKCLAFTFPSVTHPRVLVEKVFSLQN